MNLLFVRRLRVEAANFDVNVDENENENENANDDDDVIRAELDAGGEGVEVGHEDDGKDARIC